MKQNALKLILTAILPILLLFACGEPEEIEDDGLKVSNTNPSDWTIMIYMAADNNLESQAYDDLNEFESADIAADLMDIIVLFDRAPGYTTEDGNWTDTRLFKINPDSDPANFNSTRLASGELGLTTDNTVELNMANPANLDNFISFCDNEYPSEKTMLIFWNHGNGWKSLVPTQRDTRGICEDGSSGNDILLMHELMPVLTNRGIDVVGFDACHMGFIEVLAELNGTCDYVIASPDLEPGAGWNYATWPIYFANTQARSPVDLGEAIIQSYSETYEHYAYTALSLYDMSRLNTALSALDTYSSSLLSRTNSWWNDWGTGYSNYGQSDFDAIRDNAHVYSYSDSIDLYKIAESLPASGDSDLKSAIDSLVAGSWHHPTGHAGAKGLAIHFGDATLSDTRSYTINYTNLNRFNRDSDWPDYLRAFYDFPPFEFITGDTAYSNSVDEGESAFYQFYVESTGQISIHLSVPTNTDLDLRLYRNGNNISESVTIGKGTDEAIDPYALSETGWYIIQIPCYYASDELENYELIISNDSAVLYSI